MRTLVHASHSTTISQHGIIVFVVDTTFINVRLLRSLLSCGGVCLSVLTPYSDIQLCMHMYLLYDQKLKQD